LIRPGMKSILPMCSTSSTQGRTNSQQADRERASSPVAADCCTAASNAVYAPMAKAPGCAGFKPGHAL
jgi:hypothetical protein